MDKSASTCGQVQDVIDEILKDQEYILSSFGDIISSQTLLHSDESSRIKAKKTFSVEVVEQFDERDGVQSPEYFNDGTWVQCTRASCNKWRHVAIVDDPCDLPHNWICSMNPDQQHNKCSQDQQFLDESEQSYIDCQYVEGSLVWAKMDTYPWWPAMIESDPDLGTFYDCKFNLKVMSDYHVVFLDAKATRIWLPVSKLKQFKHGDEARDINGTGRLARQYSAALSYAISNAELAATTSLKDRLQTYSFAKYFRGSSKKRKSANSYCHRENHQKSSRSHKQRKMTQRGDCGRKNEQQKSSKVVCVMQGVEDCMVAKRNNIDSIGVLSSVQKSGNVKKGSYYNVSASESGFHTATTNAHRLEERELSNNAILQTRQLLSDSQGDILQGQVVENKSGAAQKKVKVAKNTPSLCSEVDQEMQMKGKTKLKKKEKIEGSSGQPGMQKSHSKIMDTTGNYLQAKKVKKSKKLKLNGQHDEQVRSAILIDVNSERNEPAATVVNKEHILNQNTKLHSLDQIGEDILLLETLIAEAEDPASDKTDKDVVAEGRTTDHEDDAGLIKSSSFVEENVDVNKTKKTKAKNGAEKNSNPSIVVTASCGLMKKMSKKCKEKVEINAEQSTCTQEYKTKDSKKPKEKKSKAKLVNSVSVGTGSGDAANKDEPGNIFTVVLSNLNDSSQTLQKKPSFKKSAVPHFHSDDEPSSEKVSRDPCVLKDITKKFLTQRDVSCDISETTPLKDVAQNASHENGLSGSKNVEKRKPVFQVNKKVVGSRVW